MPTPARTSRPAIVATGRLVLAEEGPDGLTMQRVAGRAGVRAPSLYKWVRDRSELLRLVAEDVLADLRQTLDTAARTGDPVADLRALAVAFRQFAHRDPHALGLLFATLPGGAVPDPALVAAAADPVLRVAGALAGPDLALEAARTVTAWAYGFLRMELAGGFQLGGNSDAAFDYGIGLLCGALAREGPHQEGARVS